MTKNGFIAYEDSLAKKAHDAGPDECLLKFPSSAASTDKCPRCDHPVGDHGHDCFDNAVPYVSDGPLGHGWECGLCGAFLQAG